ncbi:MAG: hypothetical protein HQ595_02180, partial [Candidatus Omnitrophica bacterium]|nr:hypothetical protein [Candidatus Omnitrophota bacterium]
IEAEDYSTADGNAVTVTTDNDTTITTTYSNAISDDAFSGVIGLNMVQQTAGINNDVGQILTVSVGNVNTTLSSDADPN